MVAYMQKMLETMKGEAMCFGAEQFFIGRSSKFPILSYKQMPLPPAGQKDKKKTQNKFY